MKSLWYVMQIGAISRSNTRTNEVMLTLGQKLPFERNAQAAAKPAIYRMGQAPTWAEDDEEGMALPVGKKSSAASRTVPSGGRAIAAPTIVSASSSAAIAAVNSTAGARPKFTAEVVRSAGSRRVADADDMDQSDDERPRRPAHSAADAPIVTVDEDEDADRRARVKAKLARQRAEEQAALDAASRQQQDDDQMQSEGEDEEFEEETDESDDEYQTEDSSRVLLKPIFVSKSDRETVDDKTLAEHADEEMSELEKQRTQTRAAESRQLLIATLKEEEEKPDEASDSEMPDDTDDLEDESAFEAWKTRELARLARDRAEREAADIQRADIERRRQMTDAEIVAENARLKPKAEKQEMRFMQKYFHRGAFYQDSDVIDEKLLKRNFHEAVGYDREVDMTMLPKVMQVKDFGMAGRTKYTHLVDQDTSQLQSNPWATAENEYGVKKQAFQRK